MYKKKIIFQNLFRKIINNKDRRLISKNKGLEKEIISYIKNSKSTGCNYSDYLAIYSYIRKNKPKSILECGTGVSTIVMAHALVENEKEGVLGKIISMESIDEYYEMAKKIMPDHFAPYVDLKLSPLIEDYYSIYRGIRYRDIPMDREYDFLFIDGPSYESELDGTLAFNFDLLHVVKNSENPVSAIIDKRVSSCYVFQKIFGTNKVKYNPYTHLGYVNSVTKYDIKHFDIITPSSAFEDTFNLIGNSKLHLNFPHFLFKKDN